MSAPASRNPLLHRKSSLSQEIRPILSATSSFAPGNDESEPASPKTVFTLGSRSSQLALVQTHIVRDALQKMHPTYSFPIITMNTAGDKNQSAPFCFVCNAVPLERTALARSPYATTNVKLTVALSCTCQDPGSLPLGRQGPLD